MTNYKTITEDAIPVPAGSWFSDLTIGANQYDDCWSSGIGRLDNLIVTIQQPPASSFRRLGWAVGLGLVAMTLLLILLRQGRGGPDARKP